MNPPRFVFASATLLSVALLSSALSTRAAVPGDEHWDNQFGPVGMNDVAASVIAQGSEVYVGGQLTAAATRGPTASPCT